MCEAEYYLVDPRKQILIHKSEKMRINPIYTTAPLKELVASSIPGSTDDNRDKNRNIGSKSV